MMSPKDYLFSVGAIKTIGRGRLSKEHIALCEAAAAKGIQIKGYSTSQVTTESGDKETVGKREKVVNTSQTVLEPSYRYGENGVKTMEAVTADGRVFDLRQACRCGYSLSGHICDDPAILTSKMIGHERVTVRPKKKVA